MRKKILFILLLLSATIAQAQIPGIYLNLYNNNGAMIAGTGQVKGYEKWIESLTFNTGGQNNTTIEFTMPISGASADLMAAMNRGLFLPKGQVSSLDYSGGGRTGAVYTITMENIRVLSCRDIQGCTGGLVTLVQLQATRIGFTYYQVTPDGRTIISRKYGFDTETNGEWLKF